MKTCSLELAKKLKEAGIDLDTEFFWHESGVLCFYGLKKEFRKKSQDIEKYPAPTTDELLEWLPIGGAGILKRFEEKDYIAMYHDHFEADKNPADVLAKLALWVKEQS
jgi:hypothetical protein